MDMARFILHCCRYLEVIDAALLHPSFTGSRVCPTGLNLLLRFWPNAEAWGGEWDSSVAAR